MKLPFRISQLKWLRYPENKPEGDGYLWFLFKNKDGNTYPLYTKWKDGQLKYLDNDEDLTAFTYDTPTVDDSDEFDFATALELMKEGKCVVSLHSYNQYWIKYSYDLDYDVMRCSTDNYCSYIWQDILGKWRLAE